MVDEPIKVEIPESAPEPVVDRFPTEKEVVESGELSPEEIAIAKESKMLSEEPEKKPDEKKPEEKKPDEQKPGEKKDEKTQEELNDEAEFAKLQEYNANEKAMYWRQKKERRKRQDAERARDEALTRMTLHEKRIEALKAEIDEVRIRKGGVKPKEGDDGGDPDLDALLNEDGTPKEGEPGKKFLTQEDLDKREKEKTDKDAAAVERAQKINAALNEQEKEAKTYIKDFDEVTDLAKELIKNPEEYFKDNPRGLARLKKQVRLMFATAAQSIEEDQEYTAADIFYEIGQMHPKYKPGGNAGNAAGDADDAEGGSKIDRLLKNANKKGSSAAVGSGGGKRFVSVDEITPEQAAKLPQKEFNKLPAHVQERLLRSV